MSESTDVIVLGVGTCGEDIALRLMTAGLDVVGIEANLIGGECPYWACLPSKFLIRHSNLVQEARRADGLVGRVTVEPDWSVVAGRLRSEVTGGWDDSFAQQRFEGKGGRLLRGRGRFVGPRAVDVDGQTVTAKRAIVIATGSVPSTPPIPGLDEVDAWTTHEAIAAEELPKSLLVVGGGAVGCELGQVYARFGVEVTIVEGLDRLLPNEEPEASAVVTSAFEDEGIEVRAGARIESVRREGDLVTALLSDGTSRSAERLLVASGRRVDVSELGLERAGIATSEQGFIEVDDRLRAGDGTWAIGDVTGKGMFTHVALHQGLIAGEDILAKDPGPADYRAVPRATFTDPEVGSVGLTEEQARDAGIDVDVVVKQVPATFRGWLHQTGNAGVVKLVADRTSGALVGATSVGPHGGELLGILSTAVHAGIPTGELGRMIYPFPTFWGAVGETLGAYGRGVARVLDPDTAPMFDD